RLMIEGDQNFSFRFEQVIFEGFGLIKRPLVVRLNSTMSGFGQVSGGERAGHRCEGGQDGRGHRGGSNPARSVTAAAGSMFRFVSRVMTNFFLDLFCRIEAHARALLCSLSA